MSFATRFASYVAILAAPFATSVIAPAHAADYDYEVGTALVCTTQAEVERFVTLFSGDAQAAVVAVNEAEHDPAACRVLDITYLPGRQIGTVRNGENAFQVVHILVVGMDQGDGMRPVKPAAFFTAFGVKEFAI